MDVEGDAHAACGACDFLVYPADVRLLPMQPPGHPVPTLLEVQQPCPKVYERLIQAGLIQALFQIYKRLIQAGSKFTHD